MDRSRVAMLPILVAALASSVLTCIIFIGAGLIGMPRGPDVPLQIAVFLSIVFVWGPAFALIPAAILGFVVERPMSRLLIGRGKGGFLEHLTVVVAAAVLLWLVLRLVVVLAGPQTRIMDVQSLVVFGIIGCCSAFSWWLLEILPGRQA